MKKGIHPEYHQATVNCSGCGSTFQVGATVNQIQANVCNQCHPFYSGTTRFVDTAGQIDRFNKKYERFRK